jgi:hypothetical protein
MLAQDRFLHASYQQSQNFRLRRSLMPRRWLRFFARSRRVVVVNGQSVAIGRAPTFPAVAVASGGTGLSGL